MGVRARITVAGLFAVSVILCAVPALADTPGCATHDEWDQVDIFMKPSTIAEIVGDGARTNRVEHGSWFRDLYDLCWVADREGLADHDTDSRYSFNIDIRDK